MLRAVLVGAFLFVATVFVHAQSVRETVGPLEQSATPSSPENPIPRRLSAPPASRVQEWKEFIGFGRVQFQVTLDAAGRIGEIRKVLGPQVQQGTGPAIDPGTQRAIADAITKSALASLSQWTYEPPKAPITFVVSFAFPSGANPIANQEPVPPFGRGGRSLSDFAAAAGAVPIGGRVKPPTKTKNVTPVYPQAAQAERVQGIVQLEVIIGVDGKVREGRVTRSVAFLDDAAIEAVRQWEYTPTELDGKFVPVVMPVTVSFNMDVGRPEPPLNPAPWPAAAGAARIGGNITVPRQTKNARPDFPSGARSRGRNEGAVLLELLLGTDGKVQDVRVLRSSPLFDENAIKAARKWEFEPTLVNGVATPLVMPATVVFSTIVR